MVLASFSGFGIAHAAEPNMADYTSYPVFMATTVEPNILIMLDNSSSMNDQAYTDEYGGSISDCGTATARLGASADDAEERIEGGDGSVMIDTTNLFIGEGEEEICTKMGPKGCQKYEVGYFDTMVGLRFNNVAVLPKAVITKAYITFQAYTNGSGNASITIRGEDEGTPGAYSTDNEDISGRRDTGASVSWSITSDWASGASYSTPDLIAIVQEIVNRPDWGSNNNMAFMFTGSGSRSARSHNYGDGSSGPVLVIEYDADCAGSGGSTRYYG